jgi:hypothetical protein
MIYRWQLGSCLSFITSASPIRWSQSSPSINPYTLLDTPFPPSCIHLLQPTRLAPLAAAAPVGAPRSRVTTAPSDPEPPQVRVAGSRSSIPPVSNYRAGLAYRSNLGRLGKYGTLGTLLEGATPQLLFASRPGRSFSSIIVGIKNTPNDPSFRKCALSRVRWLKDCPLIPNPGRNRILDIVSIWA